MKVEHVFNIKYLGGAAESRVACVVLDVPDPKIGEMLRRSDGATWTIRGIDRHPMPRPDRIGDKVGLALEPDADIHEGDDVSIVRDAPHG